MPTASKPSGSNSRTRSGARPSERKGRRPLARPLDRRWRELCLAAVATVGYGVLMGSVLPGNWPLMPFPQTHPVVLAGLIGLPVGLLLRRRWWALLLPLTLLVALNPHGAGFAGAIVAFVIAGPFATAGIAIGMAIGFAVTRRLQRLALRRMLARPARGRRPAHSANSA
jgi:hypothetical protein